MSALLSLQKLLPLQNEADALTGLKSTAHLENLGKYTTYLKAKLISTPQLLEQARIDALAASNLEQSYINSLTQTDISKLIRKFQRYQDNIKTFRGKLEPIESILNDFNRELEDLSSTLTSLKEQSSQLTNDLDSQRALSNQLNPIILDLMIPPEIVKSVISDPIDIKWLENLRFINEKSQLIESVKTQNGKNEKVINSYKDSKAIDQLESGIQLLIAKAVERIRDFIIRHIKQLRSSSKLSSQKIQQKLLQVKEVVVFLKLHQSELANQLQLAYIYTMRWYYHVRFAKYLYALEKVHLRNIDTSFVIGTSESAVDDKLGLLGSGLKGWLYAPTQSNPIHTPPSQNPQQAQQMHQSKITISDYLLSIDKRLEILKSKNNAEKSQDAIPSQIAETTPFHYWLEFVYNQWTIALVDNIVVEYLFMVEFFYQGNEKFDKVDNLGAFSSDSDTSTHKGDWATIMFENVYELGYNFVQWLISYQPATIGSRITSGTTSNRSGYQASSSSVHGTCDAYAILLMIRMIQNTQSTLHNEFHIPVLDDHLNAVLLKLWPHFTKIIDLNCDSMKKIVMRSFSSKSKDLHLAPVSVTQQFANFLLGLLKLAFTPAKDKDIEQLRGEPLFTSVTRLRNDFESVLTKLSNHLFGSKTQSTQKEIFLYNNYFLIVTILKNENGSIPESNEFIDEQIKHFELLCEAYKAN